MSRLFRSKSYGHVRVAEFKPPPLSSCYEDSDDEEEEEQKEDYNGSGVDSNNGNQFQIVEVLVTALKKSLVTCSTVERDEDDDVCCSSMDISSPVNVSHVSHVTFDAFHGFLGLPSEFQPHLPTTVPSASASVFGVSAKSMQCSLDHRGNSVPTILLMMQKRLYSQGGLNAEGIFRINADNSQQQFLRNHLNRGVVPPGIDVHCLAGFIKTWLRELPAGVLDTLTPQQVMHCNTEQDCTHLVKLLPPMEAAILDWAIHLMADVVQHETNNKMNARNIAMVFAPNMTQLADPLTALIHAVQVMNLLKTLILKVLKEREESEAKQQSSSSLDPPNHITNTKLLNSTSNRSSGIAAATRDDARCNCLDRVEYTSGGKFESFEEKDDEEEHYHSASGSTPIRYGVGALGSKYETSDWLSLRKGVRKLCRHLSTFSWSAQILVVQYGQDELFVVIKILTEYPFR